MLSRLAIIVVMVCLATPAAAECNEDAVAAFEAGKQAMLDNRFADACDLFDKSLALCGSLGAAFHLGRCLDLVGKTGSAYRRYREVEKAATDKAQLDLVREKLTELVPRLTRVIIQVATPVDDMTVFLDGRVLPRDAWGVAQIVDPGAHQFRATRPNCPTWSEERTLTAPGVTAIVVPTLKPASRAPPPDPKPPEPQSEVSVIDDDDASLMIAGIALIGVGAGAAIVGGVFGGLAASKVDESKPFCREPTICTEDGAAIVEDAKTLADVSTAMFVIGGIVAATGVVLVVTYSARETSVALAPWSLRVRF